MEGITFRFSSRSMRLVFLAVLVVATTTVNLSPKKILSRRRLQHLDPKTIEKKEVGINDATATTATTNSTTATATTTTATKPNTCSFPSRANYSYSALFHNGTTSPIKSKTLFHLHIPKVGGTAFSSAVSDTLCNCPPPSQRTYTFRDCQKCASAKLSNGRTVNILHSRVTTGWPCGVHPFYDRVENCYGSSVSVGGFQDEMAILTVLREPVTRALSEYKHTSRIMKGSGWDWDGLKIVKRYHNVTNKQLDLETWANADNSYPFHNRQMKMISGCPLHGVDWLDEQVNLNCLEKAKQNILRFGFVGLDENLDFFLGSLEAQLEYDGKFLPEPGKHKKMKTPNFDVFTTDKKKKGVIATKEIDVTPAIHATLVQRNLYDYMLYNFTREHLCRKFHMIE